VESNQNENVILIDGANERKIWKGHNKNEICCFFCVIDDKWKPSNHELFVLLQKSCECF
jgi:hypothetical protein